MKQYTPSDPVYSDSIPIVETSDTNHADNINASAKKLIENDIAIKSQVDDCGYSVVDGALNVTYEE